LTALVVLALALLNPDTANQTSSGSESAVVNTGARAGSALSGISLSPPCKGGVRGGGPRATNYKSPAGWYKFPRKGILDRLVSTRFTEQAFPELKISTVADPDARPAPPSVDLASGGAGPTPPDPPFARGGNLPQQADLRVEDSADAAKAALREGGFPWYDPDTDRVKPIWTPKRPWLKWIGDRLEIMAKAVDKFWRRFHFGGTPGLAGAGELPMTAVLLAALLAFVVVLIALWSRREYTAADRSGDPSSVGREARLSDLPEGVRPGSSDPWSEALRRRAAGDLGGAVVCLFAYQLLTLDQMGLIRLAPGRTGRQYVQKIHQARMVDSLEATLALFEDVYYGRKLPTLEAFEAVWKLALEFRERRGVAASATMSSRRFSLLLIIAIAAPGFLGVSGCAPPIDSEYGFSRGDSVNGTSAFRTMLRSNGHEVRTAIQLTEALGEWAEGIVRFAPYPGPPRLEEANWYRDWLAADRDRWLIYVVRDFDGTAEYWREVLAHLPATADPEHRTEAEEARDKAAAWTDHLPHKAKESGDSTVWFKVGNAWNPPRQVEKLSGPWATTIDAGAAGLTAHEPLEESGARVLLKGDDKPLVLEKTVAGSGRLLVIANGSFLLNEALVNSARRPLAESVVEWAGHDDRPIALVEGLSVTAGPQGPPSLWDLIYRLTALRWVAIQLSLAGFLAALARAPRLGRPKPEPASDADQPATHAKAIGILLARTGASHDAHDLLDRYRRWRSPGLRPNATTPTRITPLAGEAPPRPMSPNRNATNG